MPPIYPDLAWYSAQSNNRSLPVRCPYATVHSCPRHFQSLSLLGSEGITTKLPKQLYESILAKWKVSPLWPVIAEHASAVINHHSFYAFCPEVAFDVFRLFASSLSRHSDEIDRDSAHKAIERDGGGDQDWRWEWANVTPMHYAECPVYAQLTITSQPIVPEKVGEIVAMKPGMFGITVDVRRLLTRLATWWLSKNGK